MRRLSWLLNIISHPLFGVRVTPILLGLGTYFAITGPKWWNNFFFDHGIDFLITAWIGAGFGFMWWQLEEAAGEHPGRRIGVAVAGIVGVVLIAGWAIFSDLWLLGVAVWPGVRLLVQASSPHLGRAPADTPPSSETSP